MQKYWWENCSLCPFLLTLIKIWHEKKLRSHLKLRPYWEKHWLQQVLLSANAGPLDSFCDDCRRRGGSNPFFKLWHLQWASSTGSSPAVREIESLPQKKTSHVVVCLGFFWLITLLKIFGDVYVSKLKEQTRGERNRESCCRSSLEVCSHCCCSRWRNFLYI